MMAIRRDKLDAVFSDLVRERANWKSEYSGRADGQLECCHIYGRAKKSVRWHPSNAVCLTHGEHRHFTSHPRLFELWLESHVSRETLRRLDALAATPRKFTQGEKEGLYRHYRGSLQLMRELRERGETGRIEFEMPDPIVEALPRKRAKKKRVSKWKRKIGGTAAPRAA